MSLHEAVESSAPKKDDGDTSVITRPAVKSRPKLEKPKLYKVLLHNDNYTPMEFVVLVLQQVFHKSEADAVAIMLHAHTHEYAVAGVFSFEIAETKVAETMAMADKAQFPLLCTMEPE